MMMSACSLGRSGAGSVWGGGFGKYICGRENKMKFMDDAHTHTFHPIQFLLMEKLVRNFYLTHLVPLSCSLSAGDNNNNS